MDVIYNELAVWNDEQDVEDDEERVAGKGNGRGGRKRKEAHRHLFSFFNLNLLTKHNASNNKHSQINATAYLDFTSVCPGFHFDLHPLPSVHLSALHRTDSARC